MLVRSPPRPYGGCPGAICGWMQDSLEAGDNLLLGPRKDPEFPEAVVISDVVIIKGGAYLEPLLLEGTLPHTCCPEMDVP